MPTDSRDVGGFVAFARSAHFAVPKSASLTSPPAVSRTLDKETSP